MPSITIRSARQGLGVLQWLILVCAAALLGDVLFSGPSLATPDVTRDASRERLATGASSGPITLAELAPIWERPLRQQLIKPKPKKKTKPPPPPAEKPPSLPKLQATFVAAGHSWGLFQDAKGNRRVRKEGGQVDGFSVVSITTGKARLRHGKNEYDVRVPERKKKRRKKGIRH